MTAFPERIRINRCPDLFTPYLGTLADGRLFWGLGTFAYLQPDGSLDSTQTGERREYAMVFVFNPDGSLNSVNHKSYGFDELTHLDRDLKRMVKSLGPRKNGHIFIQPFTTTIGRVEFGLIPNEEFGLINFQPHSIVSFMDPWDGEYYT